MSARKDRRPESFPADATGDIVVFPDANALYQPDAIRKLVRNFNDPDVGCVTGEARYTKGDQSAAGIGERVDRDYEIWIKRLETGVGSMVGGDGAILRSGAGCGGTCRKTPSTIS